MVTVTKTTEKKNSKKGKLPFSTDRRRSTIFPRKRLLRDGESRPLYTDRGKPRDSRAVAPSPVVKSARITQVS